MGIWRAGFWGVFLLGTLCALAPARSQEAVPRPEELFRAENLPAISVAFKERHAWLEKDQEETAEFWASRNFSGLAFRADYQRGGPITFMVFVYPDADPFMVRFFLDPRKNSGYKNEVFRKEYSFDPHLIDLKSLWHALLDNLDGLTQGDLAYLGEESVAGLPCKKVRVGNLAREGFLLWYSPKTDLLLKTEKHKEGKPLERKEAVEVKMGPLPSNTFRIPPEMNVKSLNSADFDSVVNERVTVPKVP